MGLEQDERPVDDAENVLTVSPGKGVRPLSPKKVGGLGMTLNYV